MMTEPASPMIAAGDEHPPRRWPRRLAVAIAVLAAAAVVLAVTDPFAKSVSSVGGSVDSASLATVTRGQLASQTEVSATLGYAGSYSVINAATGDVTSLPAVGTVITQGHVLYRVAGSPVVLLYGTTPAYRTLDEGLTGSDVKQLNRDLVTLGYATSAELDPTSDYFSAETAYALERLQDHLGVTATGELTTGQVVFLPTAARITARQATLGSPVNTGQAVLSATSTARQVSIALDTTEQSDVHVGDKVTITLPNNATTPGVITSVGTVATTATGGSGATVTVLVRPTDPARTGTWDQAPVDVTITTGAVKNALIVPVDALLAQSGGRYVVEVAAGKKRTLVPVSLGLFDDADGLVQVTSTGLKVGQRVVVPSL